jgi:hypothetical protein
LKGKYIISGTADGFIEIWNAERGKLETSVYAYQAKDDIMMMDSAILSLALFENRLLASGSAKGRIAIWDIATGRMVKQFKTAHAQGINSLLFSSNGDGERIISASMDFTIKIHGIKSGSCLASLRGHTSFVNTIIELSNGVVLSGSSDGTIKVCEWVNVSSIGMRNRGVVPRLYRLTRARYHDLPRLLSSRSSGLAMDDTSCVTLLLTFMLLTQRADWLKRFTWQSTSRFDLFILMRTDGFHIGLFLA